MRAMIVITTLFCMLACCVFAGSAQDPSTAPPTPQLTTFVQVLDIHQSPDHSAPISEHSPLWQEAMVRVEQAGTGVTVGQQLLIRFSPSMDVMWVTSPKLRLGEYAEVGLNVQTPPQAQKDKQTLTPTVYQLISVKEAPPSLLNLAGISDAIVVGSITAILAAAPHTAAAQTVGFIFTVEHSLKGNITGTITVHYPLNLFPKALIAEMSVPGNPQLLCLVDGQSQFLPHLQQGFQDFTLPNRYALRPLSEEAQFKQLLAACPVSATLLPSEITVGLDSKVSVNIANHGTQKLHCDGIVLEGYFLQPGVATRPLILGGIPQDRAMQLAASINAGDTKTLWGNFICQPGGWPKGEKETIIAIRALVYLFNPQIVKPRNITTTPIYYTVATPWQTVQVTLPEDQFEH